MSRSLLSATKRLFGTTKPGSPSSAPLNSVIYAYDAPELYYRKLGDLYFMFTSYSQAFQVSCIEKFTIMIENILFYVLKFLSHFIVFNLIKRLIIQQREILELTKLGFIMPVHLKWLPCLLSCKEKSQKKLRITWKKPF